MDQNETERGIAAIIALQASVGIVEPRERAERAWRCMNAGQRAVTLGMAAAMALSGVKKEGQCAK